MKISILIVIYILSLSLVSCIVYQPQMVDIPLISEKRDLHIDAGVSVLPATSATVSYGLTDKVAIQGFGSFGADDKYYFQGAAGIFQNRGGNRVIELYGGFGYGHGETYDDANPGSLLGNYQLYFGQLNYGRIASKTSNMEIGCGIKTGYMQTDVNNRNYYNSGSYTVYKDHNLLLEPTGIIKFGEGKLRFNVKLGSTFIFNFSQNGKVIPYSRMNLGFGLNFRL